MSFICFLWLVITHPNFSKRLYYVILVLQNIKPFTLTTLSNLHILLATIVFPFYFVVCWYRSSSVCLDWQKVRTGSFIIDTDSDHDVGSSLHLYDIHIYYKKRWHIRIASSRYVKHETCDEFVWYHIFII